MTYPLLLQASLAEKTQASLAWQKYCSFANPQEEPPLSTALFPLIYRRFQPADRVYKSVYRHTWYSNQLKILKLKTLLEKLHTASIPACLLQDSALALTYYQDLGLRSIHCLVFLVPADLASKAAHILQEEEVYIQSTLFSERSIDALFKNFTYRQIPFSHFPTATILAAEDQLLLTLFQGLKYQAAASWIPDAAMILKTTPLFNWSYFIEQVGSLKLEWALYQALKALHKQSFIEIPPQVLTLFDQHTPSGKERRHAQFLKRNPQRFLSPVQTYWYAHLRNSTSTNFFFLLCTFLLFLKKTKNFSSFLDLFFFLYSKIFKKRFFHA